MRVVLDANVVVAAFASRGLCESIFEVCLSEHELVICDELLEEITRNLGQKIKLPTTIITQIKTLILEHALAVEPALLAQDACRDIDDIKVLGLAVATSADCIVTGDQDLLILHPFQNIPILSPRSFWERLNKTGR